MNSDKHTNAYWLNILSVIIGAAFSLAVFFPVWKRIHSTLWFPKPNDELLMSYCKGMEDMNEHWKKMLLSMEYAEYDRKKGFWKLITLQELADMGAILGKGTPIPVEDPLPKKK
jgi:hypothetical protein